MKKVHIIFYSIFILLIALGAASYKTVVSIETSTDNAIPRWDGSGGTRIQNSLLKILDNGTIGNDVWSITASGEAIFITSEFDILNVSNLITSDLTSTGTASFSNVVMDVAYVETLEITNPIPSSVITNVTPSRNAIWASDNTLTHDVADTGTGSPVRNTGPTLSSPILNDGVKFEQTTLSAHNNATNYVVDPTISHKQFINPTLNQVRILHATNITEGSETVFLIDSGTNATLTITLVANQFKCNTNTITISSNQTVALSFYGFGSNNTNVLATLPQSVYRYQ